MTTRHRISTRPAIDAHTWATTGISADLEQQRRQRSWRDRMPTRDDLGWFLIGVAIVAAMVGILVILILGADLLLRTFAAP